MKKDLLPGKMELVIFLAVAAICAALANLAPKLDLAMAALSVPIFIAAGIMGLRRSWQLAEIRREEIAPVRSETDLDA